MLWYSIRLFLDKDSPSLQRHRWRVDGAGDGPAGLGDGEPDVLSTRRLGGHVGSDVPHAPRPDRAAAPTGHARSRAGDPQRRARGTTDVRARRSTARGAAARAFPSPALGPLRPRRHPPIGSARRLPPRDAGAPARPPRPLPALRRERPIPTVARARQRARPPDSDAPAQRTGRGALSRSPSKRTSGIAHSGFFGTTVIDPLVWQRA